MELTVNGEWKQEGLPVSDTWTLDVAGYRAYVEFKGDFATWWILYLDPHSREIAHGTADTPGDAKNAAEVAIHRHNNLR
ncbi:hypothetical protein GS896_25675 [Rhodococcus hoagii]|nr:hypothetical protein [Prescottella equi]MBM4654104.1 hypothetical protein [Prescottella equi]MBM4719578.1 hypothetical protein [Prescottella equi]NKR23377.1 hypothetical protein [Prescottella equi]NKT56012.1 hypothetical protein [Prescottella equi]